MSNFKLCRKCGREFPATTEYFHVDRNRKDNLNGVCKKCISEKGKLYQAANKEMLAVKKKIYYESHKDEILTQKKQYAKENFTVVAARKKRWAIEHAETYKEYRKQYQKNNLDKCRIYKHNRKARARSLPNTFTVDEWDKVKSVFGNRCCYCGKEIPLTQDHFIPLMNGGEYTHDNIVPACKACNSSKSNANPFIWFHKQPFFSKKRESKILNHLRYDGDTQQLSMFCM